MKFPAIIDSAFIVATCSGVLYLLGYVHDSAELNVFGLPTSFVYAPETLLLKGFSTAIRFAMIAVPILAIGWALISGLRRIVSLPMFLRPTLVAVAAFSQKHRTWFMAIASVFVITLLFDLASSQGKDDARDLIQARADRSTQIKFKDGTQMIGVPFRSDDMFMVLVSSAQSPTGQMQVLVRRREDISEIRTLQQAWAAPPVAQSASRPTR